MLRPTTRAPVLVCHPDDVALVRGRPDPARHAAHDRRRGRPGGLQLVPTRRRSPPALALLDSPDIDSVVEANRALAAPAARRRRRVAVRDDRRPLRRRGARGSCCRRRATAARRSRSSSTACRPTPVARCAAHLRAMLAERGLGERGAARRARDRARATASSPPTALAPVRAGSTTSPPTPGARALSCAARSRARSTACPPRVGGRRARRCAEQLSTASRLRATSTPPTPRARRRGRRGGAQRLAAARRSARPLARGRSEPAT